MRIAAEGEAGNHVLIMFIHLPTSCRMALPSALIAEKKLLLPSETGIMKILVQKGSLREGRRYETCKIMGFSPKERWK